MAVVLTNPGIVAPGTQLQLFFVDDSPVDGRRYDVGGSLPDGVIADNGLATSSTQSPVTLNAGVLPASGFYDLVIRYQVTPGDWSVTDDSNVIRIFIGDECDVDATRNADNTVTFINNETEQVTITAAGTQHIIAAGGILASLPGVTEEYILCSISSGSGTGTCSSGVAKYYGCSTHMYTLANMKNYTNNWLSMQFTNLSHTSLQGFKVHTTSRTTSYYQGNGGKFIFYIYSNNGGQPGSALGQTPEYIGATSLQATGGPWANEAQARSTYPGAVWETHGETGKELGFYRHYDLTSDLPMVIGEKYHLVMKRTTSTAHGTSWNCHFSGNPDKEADPCFAEGDWFCRTSSNGTSWSAPLQHKGIFEMYGDGAPYGNTYIEVQAFSDTDKTNNLNGSSAARQLWVPHKSMQISRLRVQASRRSGSAPISWEIKDSGGASLRSGTITGFPSVSTTDARTVLRTTQRRHVDFAPLSVTAGQTYYIELKTASGTHYEVPMTRDGVKDGYFIGNPDYHGWSSGSRAQVSYNNGSSWVNPTNWNNPQDYLDMEMDVGQWADGTTTCFEDICAGGGGTSVQSATVVKSAVATPSFINAAVTTEPVHQGQTDEYEITDLLGKADMDALVKLADTGTDDFVVRIDNSGPVPRAFVNRADAVATGQSEIEVELQ